MQDALLRAWRGLPRFDGRSSLRSWLYRIATNTCLDVIGGGPSACCRSTTGPPSDPHDGPGRAAGREGLDRALPGRAARPRGRPAAPEARYEQRESVELAFIAALQHLPAAPARGADPARGARLLGAARSRRRSRRPSRRSTARCSGRARRSSERLPERASRRRCARSATTRVREIVEGYMDALGARRRRRGRRRCWPRTRRSRCRRWRPGSSGEGVEIFLRRAGRAYGAGAGAVRRAHANGQPAIGIYSWDDERGRAPADRARGADLRGRPDHRDHRLRGPVRVRAVRAARRSCERARGHRLVRAALRGRRGRRRRGAVDGAARTRSSSSGCRERALEGGGRRALVIGTALGDDAELLAAAGTPSPGSTSRPTAIEGARRRFPDSRVDYRVATCSTCLRSSWAPSTSSRSASRCRRCRCPCARGRSSDRLDGRARRDADRGLGDPLRRRPAPGRRGGSRARSSTASRDIAAGRRSAWRGSGRRRAGGGSTSVREPGASCRRTSTALGPQVQP